MHLDRQWALLVTQRYDVLSAWRLDLLYLLLAFPDPAIHQQLPISFDLKGVLARS
jgi:hypothetical protein